ncbi:MAG: hypothetical protein J2P17_07520, partial [Mycobacterium sp.]|nr:hypothetical protein [Mycobacterium sp.]
GERAGLVDEELEAMVLAALDAVAFEEPQPVTAAGVTRRWDVPIDLARADLVQEVRWWRLVARHYRRSPIVRQILAEFRVGNFSPDMEPHRT